MSMKYFLRCQPNGSRYLEKNVHRSQILDSEMGVGEVQVLGTASHLGQAGLHLLAPSANHPHTAAVSFEITI